MKIPIFEITENKESPNYGKVHHSKLGEIGFPYLNWFATKKEPCGWEEEFDYQFVNVYLFYNYLKKFHYREFDI